MSNKSKIEICANSVESAVKAQQGGAYRVELCAGIPEGGTTPSFGEIRMARQLLQQTKLHIIIRPRGGDFLYSPLEQEIMLHDIKVARQLGADGVVFGCLTADGKVDVEAMEKLMNAVGDMSVTFHRAFDMCRNPQEALEQIIELGCHRILTSGQEATAEKGIPLLKELVELADERIIIMPGCGVNPKNILSTKSLKIFSINLLTISDSTSPRINPPTIDPRIIPKYSQPIYIYRCFFFIPSILSIA